VLLLNSLGLKSTGNDPGKTTTEQRQKIPDNVHVLRHFLDDVSPKTLLSQIESGDLKVVFNFRDPRAQALSFVNYFSAEKFKSAHANNPAAANLFRIYSGLPDTVSRLRYFLGEHIFGEKYHIAFQTHTYLLLHPQVCSVRYEHLVGAEGGCSDENLQTREVRKVMRYLGIGGSPEERAKSLYRTDTDTFYSGVIDAWREHFDEEITTLFEERYPRDIMNLYGYEE
jgi:hypothetical protein